MAKNRFKKQSEIKIPKTLKIMKPEPETGLKSQKHY